MRPQFTPRDITRFWSKVDRSGGDDACWLWMGSTVDGGYGRVTASRIDHNYAHRAAWELATGETLTDADVIGHTCDVRNCVRNDEPGVYVVNGKELPRVGHLFKGTTADNMADMVAKGRQATGDRNGMRLHPESRIRGDEHWTRRMPDRVRRGDENGSHLHTENRPYGAKNGAYTHPERRPRGETNGQSKLTRADVAAIRGAYAMGGCTLRSLAAEYHVSKSLVGQIVRGDAWREP